MVAVMAALVRAHSALSSKELPVFTTFNEKPRSLGRSSDIAFELFVLGRIDDSVAMHRRIEEQTR